MKFIATVLFVTVLVSGLTQTYTMNADASYSTCTGVLVDDGGTAADYGNNITITHTICPGSPGSKVRLDFNRFSLEYLADYLTVYDANSALGLPLEVLTGTFPSYTVIANDTNSTGCLTVVFQTDGANVQPGFEAAISCVQPCQDFTLTQSFSKALNNGILELCPGEVVNVTVSGSYPNNDINYHQADALHTTYIDALGVEDSIYTGGTSKGVVFNAGGVYYITPRMMDTNGCWNSSAETQVAYVSTTPDFSNTSVFAEDVCVGYEGYIVGDAQSVPAEGSCKSPSTDTLFVADEVGDIKLTTQTIMCYGSNDTVRSVNDITDICLNMEHSSFGDLNIVVVCPNAQRMTLIDFTSNTANGVMVGEPVGVNLVGDDSMYDTEVGVGWDYCFNNAATTNIYDSTLWNSLPTYTDPAGNVSNGDGSILYQIPEGNYAGNGDWSDLIGCPLNGNWLLEVTDGLTSDNGYVLSWQIEFSTPTFDSVHAFEPIIDTTYWAASTNITATDADSIGVSGGSVGSSCFTYIAEDDFSCTHSYPVCIDVVNPDSLDLELINGVCTEDNTGYVSSPELTGGTFTAESPLQIDSDSGVTNTSGVNPGDYMVYYNVNDINCVYSDSIEVTVNDNPSVFAGYNDVTCIGDSIQFDAFPSPQTGTFVWGDSLSLGDSVRVLPPVDSLGTPIYYEVTFTDTSTMCTAKDSVYAVVKSCTYCPIPNVSVPDAVVCFGGDVDLDTIVAVGSDPHTGYWYTDAFEAYQDINRMSNTVVDSAGPFYYRYELPGVDTCFHVELVWVNFYSIPPLDITLLDFECDGSAMTLQAESGYFNYEWDDGDTSLVNIVMQTTAPVTLTAEDDEGCITTNVYSFPLDTLLAGAIAGLQAPTCFGGSNGYTTITGVNGTPGYTYAWASDPSNTTNTIGPVPSGTYQATITDTRDCSVNLDVQVTDKPQIIPVIGTISPSCDGDTNGIAFLESVSGSQGDVSLTWTVSAGVTEMGDSLYNVPEGSYSVTIVDDSLCSNTITFDVVDPPLLEILGIQTSPSDCRADGSFPGTGVLDPQITGGTGAITFAWILDGTSVSSSSVYTSAVPGDYTLLITDDNGCQDSLSADVDSINPMASFVIDPAFGDAPLDVFFVDLSQGVGVSPAVPSWTWYPYRDSIGTIVLSNSNYPFTYTSPGFYTGMLVLNNGFGCLDTAYSPVQVYIPLEIDEYNVFTPDGDGINDEFRLNVSGASSFHMVIFNRWGEKIFETDDALETWKGVTTGGTEVTEGVYFYSYTVVGDNPNDRREGHGNIQLLRGD